MPSGREQGRLLRGGAAREPAPKQRRNRADAGPLSPPPPPRSVFSLSPRSSFSLVSVIGGGLAMISLTDAKQLIGCSL